MLLLRRLDKGDAGKPAESRNDRTFFAKTITRKTDRLLSGALYSDSRMDMAGEEIIDRRKHRIVLRWISDLNNIVNKTKPFQNHRLWMDPDLAGIIPFIEQDIVIALNQMDAE